MSTTVSVESPASRAPVPPCEERLGRLEVELSQLGFELELARSGKANVEAEVRRLERRVAQLEADRAALQSRLDERERYVGAIHASGGWKLLQYVRGLFGRKW